MPEPRAQRTLVKSPPEIWAEVSDVSTLARHLGEFGEIRITRLEAETTVVWEGDRARGTVELEASGWGTKVTITAEAIAADDAEVVEAQAVAADDEVVEKDAAPVEATVEVVEPDAVENEVEVAGKEAAPVEAEVVEEAPEAEAELEAEAAPEPEAPIAAPRRGFFARLRRRRRAAEPIAIEPPAVAIREAEAESEPVAIEPEPIAIEPEIIPTVAAPEPVAEIPDAIEVPEAPAIAEPDLDGEIAASATAAIVALEPEQVEAVLVGVLDDLGSAHHRPFSRG